MFGSSCSLVERAFISLSAFEQRQVQLRTINATALQSSTHLRDDLDLLHGLQISGAQQSHSLPLKEELFISISQNTEVHSNIPKYTQLSLLIKVSTSTNKTPLTSIYLQKIMSCCTNIFLEC